MQFFTADICDANSKVSILDPIFTNYGGSKTCFGQISTIEINEDNEPLIELLKTKVEDKIAVVNVKGDYCAVVGENLMNMACKNGWKAIVIKGYVRDIHQTLKIDVGLFAIGTYPKKSIKKAAGKRAIDLDFAGVKICENDYLYADLDGIIITKQRIKF